MTAAIVSIAHGRHRGPARPLRADVPPFDPTNDAHLRTWEAIYDYGRMELRRQTERIGR